VINYLITPASLGVQFHGESLDGARFAMQTSASAFTPLFVSRFPFSLPDPVRFFGIISVFCGRFGTALMFEEITKIH
jgi:hypothetical protein